MNGQELHVAICNDDALVGSFGDVVIAIARRSTTAESVRASRNLCREVARRGRKITVLNVVGPEAGMPSRDASEEIRRMNGELGEHIAGTAIVLEGDGLWRSSMRMIARTIMMPMRKAFPRTMEASVEDAARWVEKQSGVRASDLLGALGPCLACKAGSCCGRRPR